MEERKLPDQREVQHPQRDVTAAVEAAARATQQVIAAYVFGSSADRAPRPARDIDIGLLACPSCDSLRLMGEFLESLEEHGLESESADVSLLDPDHPLLAGEVLTSGRLVFVRDRAALADFVARVLPQYFDMKIRLRALRKERYAR